MRRAWHAHHIQGFEAASVVIARVTLNSHPPPSRCSDPMVLAQELKPRERLGGVVVVNGSAVIIDA